MQRTALLLRCLSATPMRGGGVSLSYYVYFSYHAVAATLHTESPRHARKVPYLLPSVPYHPKEWNVIKGEQAKRVASGEWHFRPTSDELGLRVH